MIGSKVDEYYDLYRFLNLIFFAKFKEYFVVGHKGINTSIKGCTDGKTEIFRKDRQNSIAVQSASIAVFKYKLCTTYSCVTTYIVYISLLLDVIGHQPRPLLLLTGSPVLGPPPCPSFVFMADIGDTSFESGRLISLTVPHLLNSLLVLPYK